MNRALTAVTAALSAATLLSAETASRTKKPLTIEAYARDWAQWAGMSPDRIRWTPDGKSIYFEWNPERADLSSLYVVDAAGGAPRKVPAEQLAKVPQPPPGRGSGAASVSVPNRDGTRVAWERDGDIYVLDVASSRITRVTSTEAAESDPQWSHDEQKVTFESGGNLFAYSLAGGGLAQLTRFRSGREADAAKQGEYERYLGQRQLEIFETLRHQEDLRKVQQERRRAEAGGTRPKTTTLRASQDVQDLRLSPDERYVTFILADSSRVDPYSANFEIARFVTPSGRLEIQKGGTGRASDPFRDYSLGIVNVADGTVKYVDAKAFGKAVSWNSVVWSPDGARAVAWAGSLDHKDLWLTALDVATAAARPLFHDHDDAWLRGFRSGRFQRGDGQVTDFLPDNRTVYFMSERDGWFHLYTMDAEAGGEPKQLTKGPFEVIRPVPSKDGRRWFFLSSEGDPLQRHFYTMPIGGGPRTRLTPGDGFFDDAQLSPDQSQVAFLYGDPDHPDELYVMPTQPESKPRRLTQSTTEEFRSYKWLKPEFVTFKDAEGFTIHASLLQPPRPHPARPAIIFVHGTGWTQGVSKDYAPYTELQRGQFQFYADHGYTVLAVDYKGSRGYGRESRVSIYRKAGEPEVNSLVAAVDYLVENHGVDRKRVGIYGHSWGGFVVNLALFTRPGVFAGGVTEAGMSDHGQQGTTSLMTRIIGTPMQEPEVYKRAAPIEHVQNFRDRLLILHGLLDLNVPVQQAFMLVQRLQELKKTGYDIAIYPLESHLPHLESSILDMERRRYAFFEEVLKGEKPAVARAAAAAGR
jgi:dipeptidyl aminopeptidase/acylaminoacyl peptidase